MSVTPEVSYRVFCEHEDTPVRGNAQASGDDADDKAVEDKILAELEHNPWAWCCVQVTATVISEDGQQFEGEDFLGCCSYKSQAEFEADGYFEDMKKNALKSLLSNLGHAVRRGVTAAGLLKVLQHP